MSSQLMDILDRMTGGRVLVVGDIMLDRFVYGDVERISPESPVPVLTIARESTMLGGAGNVLSNLAGLNVARAIIGIVGEDGPGGDVEDLVVAEGAERAGLIIDETRPTTVKTRYLAGNQQLLRTDYEDKAALAEVLEVQILKQFTQELEHCGAVVISDYGKGMLSPEILRTMIDAANKRKIPVLVDPKGNDYRRYKGTSVITPNKKELSEASGLLVESDEDVTKAAQKIIKDCGIKCVIATRSKDGMSIVRRQHKQAAHLQTRAIEVYDVSGAGDTVIAVAAAALAGGADVITAAQLANIAGGIVVAKVGTAAIRMGELREAVAMQAGGDQALSHQAPICDWEQAKDVVQRWRARGQKIGFTNGCFDILHRGHVDYLREARGQCDRLIVGLNTDTSVKFLKGPNRPLNDEEARAQVMAGLAAVDMVVLFGAQKEGEDNTPCALIDRLQPDMFFKGGDYTVEQLPEAKVVKSYGGKVVILSLSEGHSTSATIEKLKQKAA